MVCFIDAPGIARHEQANVEGVRERRVLDHALVGQNNFAFPPSFRKALGHRGTKDLKVCRFKDPGMVVLSATALGTSHVKVLLVRGSLPAARGLGTLSLLACFSHCCKNRGASSRGVLGLKAGGR